MNKRGFFLALMVLGCGNQQWQVQNFSDALQCSRKISEEEQEFYALASEKDKNGNINDEENNKDIDVKNNDVKDNINIENKQLSSNNWMERVDGSKKLNQLNIPGSHDSLAYNISDVVKRYAQCQNYTLKEQLENGIRIFDIRLFYDKEKNEIFCCHGKGIFQCNCHQKGSDKLISYDFVLSTIANFLKDHPTETVIIAPKHESGNKQLTNRHIDLEHKKLNKFGIIYTANRVPSLNEVRGKIVLWDKKNALQGGMKILTTDEHVSSGKYAGVCWKIQKKFKTTPDEKVSILKRFLYNAKTSQDVDHGYINYTSGFDSFVFLPDSSSVAKSVNNLIKNYEFKKGYLYGWLIGDFVDVNYAKAIYMSNFIES